MVCVVCGVWCVVCGESRRHRENVSFGEEGVRCEDVGKYLLVTVWNFR